MRFEMKINYFAGVGAGVGFLAEPTTTLKP
jgi:hypothetical protein